MCCPNLPLFRFEYIRCTWHTLVLRPTVQLSSITNQTENYIRRLAAANVSTHHVSLVSGFSTSGILCLQISRHVPLALVDGVGLLERVGVGLGALCDRRRRVCCTVSPPRSHSLAPPYLPHQPATACIAAHGVPPSASAWTACAGIMVTFFAPIGMQSSSPLIISSGVASGPRKFFCGAWRRRLMRLWPDACVLRRRERLWPGACVLHLRLAHSHT